MRNKFMAKELCMYINHSKAVPDSTTLRIALHQLTRPSAVSTDPDCTCSRARSMEEKLTGVLIILSILALILTL
jgi:hypothetical protein